MLLKHSKSKVQSSAGSFFSVHLNLAISQYCVVLVDFMTSFLNAGNVDALRDIGTFRNFGDWVMLTLTELMYLRSVCLSLNENKCTTVPDPLLVDSLTEMETMITEVAFNLQYVEDCVADRPTDSVELLDTKLVLCVVNEQGYPVPQGVPEYRTATPIYSKWALASYADELGTDVTNTLGAVVDGTVDVLGALEKAKKFTAALGATGAGLLILTHFMGKSETDLTQELIKQQFDITNQKLDELSDQVFEGVLDIKTDLGETNLRDSCRSSNVGTQISWTREMETTKL